MIANTPAQWIDFFIASAGASATLAGLVIVAISVNVKQILTYKHLPSRAAATIGLLILILVSSVAGLIKAQTLRAFGVEVLGFSLIATVLICKAVWTIIQTVRQYTYTRPWYEVVYQVIISAIGSLAFIVGSIFFLNNNPTGFYWLAAGTITAFIVSTVNAWVLLVEILR